MWPAWPGPTGPWRCSWSSGWWRYRRRIFRPMTSTARSGIRRCGSSPAEGPSTTSGMNTEETFSSTLACASPLDWTGQTDRMTTWPATTFLGGLPEATAKELVGLSVQRQFAPGRVVLREGDRETHVELLITGFVKVTTSVDGFETLLGIRVPGEVVGEVGALTGAPRNATVTACGRV